MQKRQRQDRAAAAIQALWRGHCGRRRAERQREAVRGAQQAAVRRRAAAERVQQGREAVLRAQRAKVWVPSRPVPSCPSPSGSLPSAEAMRDTREAEALVCVMQHIDSIDPSSCEFLPQEHFYYFLFVYLFVLVFYSYQYYYLFVYFLFVSLFKYVFIYSSRTARESAKWKLTWVSPGQGPKPTPPQEGALALGRHPTAQGKPHPPPCVCRTGSRN